MSSDLAPPSSPALLPPATSKDPMAQRSKSSENPPSAPRKLSAISITGFKSLRDRSTLRIAPLTLL
ncbi:MAG TPA: hypothetical protein PLA94_15650, partial [Myxococcota bacterium]|nr:hypothetical protein [Myxococcota bacterium]